VALVTTFADPDGDPEADDESATGELPEKAATTAQRREIDVARAARRAARLARKTA
jgi:hypothetical protein